MDKSMRSALREMDEGKSSSFLQFVVIISSAEIRKCLVLDTGEGDAAESVGALSFALVVQTAPTDFQMPNAGGINVSLTEDFFPKPLLF
jgi:hypothetical protein